MQTKAGGITLRNTMIKKLGSEEKWREFMRANGSIGGSVKSPKKGFGSMEKAKVREAGRKGGAISRRGRVVIIDEDIPQPKKWYQKLV